MAIGEAFQAALPEDGYNVERDDWEGVLVKKRGDTLDFGLELIFNSVRKAGIVIKKE